MQQILIEFERIKQLVGTTGIDVAKFVNDGNKAASVRVRKNMKEVMDLAKELRKLITEAKNQGVYKREA
ncbi:MAG: histone H1 [Bacteroidales bacterium]|nr:histone H1 [Bacteroidales bacterium]